MSADGRGLKGVLEANATLERVVAGQLPALNSAYLSRELLLEELADLIGFAVVDVVDAVNTFGTAGLTVAKRERLMVTLGFIIGTFERHAQSEGRPASAGIGIFPGFEAALRRIAGDDLPWRDTARTFWVLNRAIHGPTLLTYTADRGERFFNQQVCELNDALTLANDLLRNVVGGSGTLTAQDAEQLSALPDLVRRYKAAYSDFRRRDAEGLPITPHFFTFVFRTFLPPVMIEGEVWQGPNAAWLANVFSFDSLLGTATGWYQRYNLDKAKYLTAAESNTVRTDLAGPSMTDVLAGAVRLPAGLASVPPAELASRLDRAGRHVVDAARSVRDAWLELVKGTRGHETLVRDFLDKPSEGVGAAELEHMAVKPSEGTGGGTRDLLADIGNMRKACVPAHALVGALRLLEDRGDSRSAVAA